MQNSDQGNDQSTEPAPWSAFDLWFEALRAARDARNLSQPLNNGVQPSNPGIDATNPSLSDASQALEDVVFRLLHIRNALHDLEFRGLALNGGVALPNSSTRETASASDIGPGHAAILLSNNSRVVLGREALGNELRGTLPHPVQNATDIIRSITQVALREITGARGNISAVDNDFERSVNVSESTSQVSASGQTMASSHAPGSDSTDLPISNTSQGGRLHHRRSSNSQALVNMLQRRREWFNDLASTSLGRRVAARTIANRSNENTSDRPRLRTVVDRASATDESRTTLHNVLRSSASSRRLIAPRISPSHAPRNSQDDVYGSDDNGGSDTEVDDSLHGPASVSQPPDSLETSGGEMGVQTSTRAHSLPSVYIRTRLLRNHSTRPSRQDAMESQTAGGHLQNDGSETRRADIGLARPEGFNGEGAFHDVFDEGMSGRTYRIRRRFNANGEEQVHHIRTDDWWGGTDDELDDWFNPAPLSTRSTNRVSRRSMRHHADLGLVQWPGGESRSGRESSGSVVAESGTSGTEGGQRTRQTNFQTAPPRPARNERPPGGVYIRNRMVPSLSMESNSNELGVRRRGWARLNANGDEIPTDEEEELERERTERRLRSSDSSLLPTLAGLGSTTSRDRTEYTTITPTTRNTLSYSRDNADEDTAGGVMRVRLNLPVSAHHRRQLAAAREATLLEIKKEFNREQEQEPRIFGTTVPYHLDPLPVPSAQYFATLKPQTRKGASVSRQSEIAAR